jgi:pimeloyl-ACP methyl ester carboxylesterase
MGSVDGADGPGRSARPDEDDAPDWFTAALADVPTHETTVVDGVEIAFRAWGSPGAQGLVLVHGGAAQSGWWDHIGPMLAGDRRVVAIDLSGHGDSGRRRDYTLDGWAEEILAVAAAGGIAGLPTVVGHSMGGFVSLQAAVRFGARLKGIVVLDSPVRDVTPEEKAAFERRAFGPLRLYPTREAAMARFRPIPDQDGVLPYIRRHVAETSVREVEGGWTWKFDRAIFLRPSLSPSVLSRLECRVALFRAEYGRMSKSMSDVLYDRLGHAAPVIEIPAAGHHVMLDQPLALVTGLRTLLSDWEHSTPSAPA